MFAYLLLLLLPVAAVAYIVLEYRRKTAERDAASTARMEQLLGVATHAPVPAPTDAAPIPPATDKVHTPQAPYMLRERLLTPPQTLLYYLLKTGLPDHTVFAQMPVGSVLEPGAGLAPYAREEQARMFSRHLVDFVVADKSTRPAAVVKLTSTADTHQSALVSLRTWFAEAGIRYVEVDATALPRKESVRALVLGDVDQHAGDTSNAATSG